MFLVFACGKKKLFMYLCIMKKSIFLFMAFGLMLCACQPEPDTLIGTWTVEKVKVQFDESRTTPELVKQVGEMERQNTLSIGTDSTLVFNGIDEQWKQRVSLTNDSVLYCNGTIFGFWKDGKIVTRTGSPLGQVIVIYKKD